VTTRPSETGSSTQGESRTRLETFELCVRAGLVCLLILTLCTMNLMQIEVKDSFLALCLAALGVYLSQKK